MLNQLTIGDMIRKLEDIDLSYHVFLDYNGLGISNRDFPLYSYRGYYEDLAINPSETVNTITVEKLLESLRDSLGKLFTGYKGGEYEMNADTDMWIAGYGDASGRYPVDIRVAASPDGPVAVIITETEGD